MSGDLVKDYLAAKQELDQIIEEIEEQVGILGIYAQALTDGKWKRTMFDNADVEGWPAEIGGRSVDVNRYPSMREIASKASRYHELLHQARWAYTRLSDTDRNALRPPDP